MSVFLDKLKNVTEENKSLLTLFAAVAPFLLSLLFLISLAHGNVQIVSYLVSRLGLVDVWIVGVLGLIIAMLHITVLSALLYVWENRGKLEDWKLWSTGILTTIACTIIPIAVVLGGAVGGVIRFIVLHYDKSKGTSHLKRTQQSAKTFFIYLAFVSLALSITAYPQLPQTIYTLKDNRNTIGKEMAHDNMTTLLLEKESDQLKLLDNSEIVQKEICIVVSKNWGSKTIYELLLNKNRISPCE